MIPEAEAHRSSVKSATESKNFESKECRRDYSDMPLKEKETYSRHDSVNTSLYLQENSKGSLYTGFSMNY